MHTDMCTRLVSEPGPYGLHESMFLVGMAQCLHCEMLISNRLHSMNKALLNKKNTSSQKQRTTRSLDVTLRQSLAMVQMSEGWRRQQLGMLKIRHSRYILRI